MKKLTLSLCAVVALASAAYAGTERYSGKEMKQTTMPPPCPQWYADNEVNISISGVYAPTSNDYVEDRYLGVDHAWGGVIDAKYFFHRYYGVGIQGFGLSVNNNSNNDFRFSNLGINNDNNNGFVGGVLGTFTVRYPIPCTRFAPYAWVGVGGIFGGGTTRFNDDNFTFESHDDSKFMGQYGGGFEVRITPHIGLTNDISFNQVEGGSNDFFQIRTGLNFAF